MSPGGAPDGASWRALLHDIAASSDVDSGESALLHGIAGESEKQKRAEILAEYRKGAKTASFRRWYAQRAGLSSEEDAAVLPLLFDAEAVVGVLVADPRDRWIATTSGDAEIHQSDVFTLAEVDNWSHGTGLIIMGQKNFSYRLFEIKRDHTFPILQSLLYSLSVTKGLLRRSGKSITEGTCADSYYTDWN